MNYLVEVKKPIEFLSTLVERFQINGTLSMEGDLSAINLSEMFPVGKTPTEFLPKQGMITRKNQYASIQLDTEIISKLQKSVFPRIGLRNRVAHVQISVNNCHVLGAYDWFAEDCVWVDLPEGDGLLEELKEKGIIRKFGLNPNHPSSAE